MTTIGSKTVGLHSVDKDETVYAGSSNTVSHVDQVALRRTLPKARSNDPLRTQVRFEQGFPVSGSTDGLEKSVTVSIAVTVPPGISTTDAKSYVEQALEDAAATAANLAITGDIHLEA